MELNRQKIFAELKRLSWSKSEFARQLKVDRQYVHRLLKGKQNLTFNTVVKIGKCLNLDPKDLLR